eukprot:TRINITY_DN6073_c0_g1_i1.p1 TRINITY_DN6073_c0_g1~~TRINITY_DN6073_c0_g1_i1.p1  ORF type:complete len:278 (+),score=78.31 TRINITY_DN6073_c0_g1_i1:65-898(+)
MCIRDRYQRRVHGELTKIIVIRSRCRRYMYLYKTPLILYLALATLSFAQIFDGAYNVEQGCLQSSCCCPTPDTMVKLAQGTNGELNFKTEVSGVCGGLKELEWAIDAPDAPKRKYRAEAKVGGEKAVLRVSRTSIGIHIANLVNPKCSWSALDPKITNYYDVFPGNYDALPRCGNQACCCPKGEFTFSQGAKNESGLTIVGVLQCNDGATSDLMLEIPGNFAKNLGNGTVQGEYKGKQGSYGSVQVLRTAIGVEISSNLEGPCVYKFTEKPNADIRG